MRVYKTTPMTFAFLPWAVKPPAMSATFVVKATLDIVPGGVATLAEEQRPPLGDTPFEDEAGIRQDSDVAIFKPHGEWMVVGSAHQVGAEAPRLVAAAQIGAGPRKEVVVFGDRARRRGLAVGALGAPASFRSMPLRWSRAFGGEGHAENPVGSNAPNLERRHELIVSASDRPRPTAFAPIPRTWPSRTRHTGTYDERWARERWPWFPEDFSYRYYQAAPEDQRIEGYFTGDETIVLEGLHPEHSTLSTTLPGLRPRCFIERCAPGADIDACDSCDPPRPRLQEVRLALDTITIDSDRAQIELLFRGGAAVADDQLGDVGRLFFLHESPDASVSDPSEALRAELIAEAAEFAFEEPDLDLEVDDAPPANRLLADLTQLLAAQEDGAERLALIERAGEEAPLHPLGLFKELVRAVGEEVPPSLAELEEPLPEPTDVDHPSLTRMEVLVRKLKGLDCAARDYSGARLRGLDLTGVCFDGALLKGADLSGCVLEACSMREVVLDDANLRGARLSRASLLDASLVGAALDGANLREVDACTATFDEASLASADLRGATLSDASFVSVAARDARFGEATLDGADLDHADLGGADLRDTSLVDTSFEHARLQRASLDRARARDARFEGANLEGASLHAIDAPGSQWPAVVLDDASMLGATLDRTDFSLAKARRTRFGGSTLREARFDRADLSGASFIGSDLFEATFEAADLTIADLRGVSLYAAQLWQAKIFDARLESADVTRTLLERGLLGSTS